MAARRIVQALGTAFFFIGCAGGGENAGRSSDGGAEDVRMVMDAPSLRDSGRDATDPEDAGGTDADSGVLAAFGETCTSPSDCRSNICVLGATNGTCSRTCDGETCPDGYGCFGVLDVVEAGIVTNVCVPLTDQLCTPCESDDECAALGGDLCLTNELGDRFCGRDCSSIACPVGYICEEMTISEMTVEQCVPEAGTCDCNGMVMGADEACVITTPLATSCDGNRVCGGAMGWSECMPPSSTDEPDELFVDSNCDGIDGDLALSLLVSTAAGNDTATCGLDFATPCRTIAFGIERAQDESRSYVLIQAGTYSEVVRMVGAIHLIGGYASDWSRGARSDANHKVTISGAFDATESQTLTLVARSINVATRVMDLVVQGANATGTSGPVGLSSYAVYANDANYVTFERVSIKAGNGANGSPGSSGSDAPIVQATTGMSGQPYMPGRGGEDASRFSSACNDSDRGDGGDGGDNTCSSTGRNPDGGDGGDGGAMDDECGWTGLCSGGMCTAEDGSNGSNASYASGAYGGGGGGGDGSSNCDDGVAGEPGAVANGTAGAGASSNTGMITAGFWYARSGANGGVGSNGGGGGGGGGSGGCDVGTDSYGAGGGGGGAGGCRAEGGGGGGGGGGGSFGLFAYDSMITLVDCDITLGTGGTGGNGGTGGRGQSGGTGGAGGDQENSGNGGDGGNGGHGGHGGGGGGGAGGSAYGIFSYVSTIDADCTYTGGTAGSRGTGGQHAPTAPSSERDGNNGTNGVDGEKSNVDTCASLGTC